MRLVGSLLLAVTVLLPGNLFGIGINCNTEPAVEITSRTHTAIYFVGGGPQVTSLDFMDTREDGEARFSRESDFVGVRDGQPYGCLEKATSLANIVVQTSDLLYPGAVLVPVRIQNCKGQLFKDSRGRDIDPRAVAAWLAENARSPSVVVLGFVPSKKTPHFDEFLQTLKEAGLIVILPNGRSGAALLDSLLRAGREAATFQALLQESMATDSCASTSPPDQTVRTGTYTTSTFPCEDTSKKNQAIQNLLSQLGYTAALCTGSCTNGGCKAKSLTSGLYDDVNLQLVDDLHGTCYYTATVTGTGSAYFRASCGCIC